MAPGKVAENYRRIRESLPEGVALVVAAKGRTADEVAEVIEAGARIIGHNYVQEAEAMRAALGPDAERVEWHLIGHLQRNKVRKALPLFDLIQSLDSLRLAQAVSRRLDRPMPVLIEVNIAGEATKSGVAPEGARELIEQVSALGNLRVEGLMTMEPYFEDPEDARPYLRRMHELFEELKEIEAPNVRIEVLSMGMTNSYRVAVEEGATMVRIGTAIFGPRPT